MMEINITSHITNSILTDFTYNIKIIPRGIITGKILP
jgi:hypothetical protein